MNDASCVVPMLGEADQRPEQKDAPELATGGIEGESLSDEWNMNLIFASAVFGRDSCPYVFCQQRAPTIASKKAEHAELVAQFLANASLAAVLVLTSMDIASSTDDYDLMSPFRSIIPETASNSDAPLIGRLREIPAHTSQAPDRGLQVTAPSTAIPDMPGSGSARRIMSELAKTSNMPPQGTLAAWCAEADNRADAHGLANVVLFCLGQGER